MASTEEQAFERGCKKAAKNLEKLWTDPEEYKRTLRSIERLYNLGRFMPDPNAALERVQALHRSLSEAAEAGMAARRAEREAEIARLDEQIRERNAAEGGFEKELRLMRGRR